MAVGPGESLGRNWAINGRFLSQPLTGVQRYAREILRRLDDLVGSGGPLTRDVDVELLVPPDATVDFALSAIRIRMIGTHNGHLWEQVDLPREVRGGILSLCNTGPVVCRHQIVCIHDTNTFNVPESYSRSFRLAYRALMPALGHVVAKVATVSSYSASELARHRVARPTQIFLAPNGHEHVLAWSPCHSERTRAAAGPATVVLVGSHAPHKNVAMIVDLAPRLADAGLRIAVVGSAPSAVFRGGVGLADRTNVAWLGRISDGELAALLQDSLCLAFPSLEEGFGLPPLEAMALGCPVISSDRASLPEICGDAALLVPPDAPDRWVDALVALRRSPELASRLATAGRRQAAAFNWDTSARRYLEAMAEIDGLTSPTPAAVRRPALT